MARDPYNRDLVLLRLAGRQIWWTAGPPQGVSSRKPLLLSPGAVMDILHDALQGRYPWCSLLVRLSKADPPSAAGTGPLLLPVIPPGVSARLWRK